MPHTQTDKNISKHMFNWIFNNGSAVCSRKKNLYFCISLGHRADVLVNEPRQKKKKEKIYWAYCLTFYIWIKYMYYCLFWWITTITTDKNADHKEFCVWNANNMECNEEQCIKYMLLLPVKLDNQRAMEFKQKTRRICECDQSKMKHSKYYYIVAKNTQSNLLKYV